MKNYKKIVSLLLAAVTAFSLTACGGGVPENTVFSEADLVNKTIGVQLGTTGDIYASDYEAEGSTIERYNKGADAVAALKNGNVDCVIIDNEPAKSFVAANAGLKILDTEYVIEDYAICISKDQPELLAKINKALEELIADGTVQKTIDKYISAE